MSVLRRDPRLFLVALASSATAIALSLTGEVAPVGLAVPFIAAFAVARPRTLPRGRAFEWTFQLIALVFLGWFVVNWSHGQVLGGAAVLTFPVQAHALLQPPDLRSLKRLQTIGFFQLVALAASTTAIFFGPLLLLHLLLAPALFSLASLESAEGEPRRAAALPRGLVRAGLLAAAAVFASGALLFLLLPRYEAGLMSQLRQQQRMSGFSERVALGDITRIQGSDAIVMRVELQGEMPADLRWRGIALDEFSGREWRNTSELGRPRLGEQRIRASVPGAPRLVQSFSLEPSAVRALFHAQGATMITPENFGGVRVDEWRNIQRSGDALRRPRYVVVSDIAPDPDSLGESARAAFLQLPDLDERVEELALSVAGEGDDAVRAQRLETFLQGRCEYSLDVNDQGVADPVAWFLFDGRRGHCEYFATSMAVMLRGAGIPSRVVNGFLPGEYSRLFGAHVVRQRDAHSWVEAWLPGRGWTTFDPTPPSEVVTAPLGDARELWNQIVILWDDNVIGFNVTFQLGFLTTVREWWDAARGWSRGAAPVVFSLATAVVLVAAGATALLVLRRVRRRRPSRRPVAFYAKAQRLLARRGHHRRPTQTPWEHAREVAARDPDVADATLELTRLYYDVRYGGATPDRHRVDELLRRLAA